MDFFANRLYVPLTVNAIYALTCYSLAVLAMFLLVEIERMVRLPELHYFKVPQNELAWWLPAIIMLGFYFAMRLKFWYLGDGDLVFNFDEWALQANARMDWIENDGVREETFRFNIEGEDYANYSDPEQLQQRYAARRAEARQNAGLEK